MSKTFLALAVGAAAVAVVALGATLPAASTRAPAPWTSEYRPVQSITQEFGSKVASGYFLSRDGACAVTLMVGERSDPEAPHTLSAARLRVTLGSRHVDVRVNDRGPYAKHRILDVSGRAARVLDLQTRGHGVAEVCVTSPQGASSGTP